MKEFVVLVAVKCDDYTLRAAVHTGKTYAIGNVARIYNHNHNDSNSHNHSLALLPVVHALGRDCQLSSEDISESQSSPAERETEGKGEGT
ncbi:hypothetical protein E2C01_044854 [Portunus trituberculatus]|uniref:Uncharacterized protein n=1 Tax=Portunus trituberculatus TaxID=210409 RepID=A0A5B7G095_PORTR|nr:hypothetical protein [Portunus trituberculatus]